jgi:outer membrane receptor protein involved in Fe transport
MPIQKSLRERRLLSDLALVGFFVALLSARPSAADGRVEIAQAETGAKAEKPAPSPPSESRVEEIVVKGAASAAAQDFNVADSVTAFSTADLVALGAANISDLAAFTPNLEIVTAGATTPTFFIRGVGLNDFNANSTGAVAIYQDDVALNAPALQLSTLFDMETVNVLRGPQGSGLNRNSSAGAIKLYGRKPTGQFNGFLRGTAGNYGDQEYEGAVEAPIFEDILSGRLAFTKTQRDGTVRNRCGGAPPREQRAALGSGLPTDKPWSVCGETVTTNFAEFGTPLFGKSTVPAGLPDHVNDKNSWAARGTLLFEPTLDTSFLLNGHTTHRNEFSRLGKSYGTNGTYCLNGIVNVAPGHPFGLCDDSPDQGGGTKVFNWLGGPQGAVGFGYQDPEVLKALSALAPCFLPNGLDTCASRVTAPNGASFVALDRAKQIVARELARNLDNEPWQGSYNRVGKTVNDTMGVSLKSEILLPWSLELDLVSGFDRYRRKIDLDLDFSPETLFQVLTRDQGYQFYQDAKLAGEVPVNDTPVTWDIGGWVLPEKLDVNVRNDLGTFTAFGVGERQYTQRLLSMGGYGSFSFDFADDFTLDGGVRYNWERKEINYLLSEFNGQTVTPLYKFNIYRAPTGTIRLTYRFREDTHAFLKYTRGWKPGHYNATGSAETGITTANPEEIDSYETGLRAAWFGGILGGEASLFYYNYHNYQIFTAQQYAGSGPEFVVINANDAEVYGAEVNALVRPWPGGYVNVNFGWLESQFLDFLLLQQDVENFHGAQTTLNRELQNSGNPLLNSPKFKVAITAEQAIPLGNYGYLIPRYDGAWSDDTYYDATKGRGIPNINNIPWAPKLTFAQRAHWIHNARVGYRTPDGRLEIAGWVRNAENKAVKTFAFDGSTFQRTTIYFINDPRTWGGTVTVTF